MDKVKFEFTPQTHTDYFLIDLRDKLNQVIDHLESTRTPDVHGDECDCRECLCACCEHLKSECGPDDHCLVCSECLLKDLEE